jgi:hypothetical protein
MTYGPPSEPNASAPRPSGPNFGYSASTPPHTSPQPPAPQPGAAPEWPDEPPAADGPTKGNGLAVAALVLGLLGVVVPFLPVNLDRTRPYFAFAFGLAGLVLAILALTGRRRGKPMAVAAGLLSVLALVVGTFMVTPIGDIGDDEPSAESEAEARTQQVLREDLNVSFGDVRGDTAENQNLMVTLYNKGSDMADFYVTIELTHHRTQSVCQTSVSASALKPGDTYERKIFHCFDEPLPLVESGREVVEASKSNF